MSEPGTIPSNTVSRWWNRLSRWPGGQYLFSFVLNRYIPYTGSLSSTVIELRPGHARVRLRERRKLRNHLRSIHAIALANLAEFTGNLALACGLDEDLRFIPTGLSIEYVKKARGVLIGECRTELPAGPVEQKVDLHVKICDAQGDVVCRAVVHTLIGPKRKT